MKAPDETARDRRARDLFLRAAEIQSPEARAAYLAGACQRDDSLRSRVEALLADHRDDGFLEQPAGGELPTVAGAAPLAERPGTVIGRYKLLQQIGEGGCGVVFMAEQEEPVRRRVALKVIKPGMDTKSVIARFEAERQALAMMDHPNIAKVLDAGATESGRPFFVMELVKGIPITRYCDEARLTTRQRLDVFMPVCQAIQHAHQKGVIHRDLKPSNILVTLHDGRPVPKVIDFGIAKAVEGRLTDATLFTSFEQFIGTPAYMSPEQAQLSGLDIDTRSDIYSLGVLLYELLTGRTPFDARELLASGLDAMRRTIREVEPPRPSTRLSTLQGEALTATAQAHGTDGLKLAGGVRGDLDWIVMKCLEKDRARRYETASGLVSDIQRHLRHEPIVARPPSPAYRLQKAVRRNKLAFAAAGAVVLALAAGLAAALWQGQQKTRAYREARAAEAAARLEAEKSRQVVGLFRKIFGGMKHSVALGRDTSLIRERAEEMVSELHRQPDLAPEVSVELRANLATIYHVTGQHARAEALHRETLPRLRAQAQARPLDLTAALRDFACVLQHVNKLAEAETNALEALRRSRELEGTNSQAVADSLSTLSLVLRRQDRLVESEAAEREALALERQLHPAESLEVAGAATSHAIVLGKLGRFAEAEPLFQEGLATVRKLFPETHPAVAYALEHYAHELFGKQKLLEAAELYLQLLPIQKKLHGEESAEVDITLLNLSATLTDGGRPAQGEPFARQCLALRLKRHGPDHPLVTLPMNNLAVAHWKQGRLAEAEGQFRELLALLDRQPATAPDHWRLTFYNLLQVLHEQRKHAEAEQLITAALAAKGDARNTAFLWQQRGNLHARAGRWAEAAAAFRRAVELEPDNHEPYHALAPLLVRSGDLAGYRRHVQTAAARFRDTQDPNVAERMAKDALILPDSGADPDLLVAWTERAVTAGQGSGDLPWFQLARALSEHRQGRFAEAADWAQKVLARPDEGGRDVPAAAVLAMAQHRLNQPEAARATLARAGELAAKLPRLESGDLGGGWLKWLIAQALLDEARNLIEGRPTTTAEAPSPLP